MPQLWQFIALLGVLIPRFTLGPLLSSEFRVESGLSSNFIFPPSLQIRQVRHHIVLSPYLRLHCYHPHPPTNATRHLR
jgi:hypothetical protein